MNESASLGSNPSLSSRMSLRSQSQGPGPLLAVGEPHSVLQIKAVNNHSVQKSDSQKSDPTPLIKSALQKGHVVSW